MNILITGKNSYIGNSFLEYAMQRMPEWKIDCISLRDGSWKEQVDFSKYDTILHVAGKAHADIGNVTEEVKQEYYALNYELTLLVANKAKEAGVSQFIYLSSIIVYGDSAPYGKNKVIKNNSGSEIVNFYGDSKWKADQALWQMRGDKFRVSVIRLPMVYGQKCKGNYQMLSKMAIKLPIFPNINNERSMIYIENLCELLTQLIENKEGGIFFPQNRDYVSTSELVKIIANTHGKSIILVSFFNPLIWIAGKIPGKISVLVNKAFGNLIYDSKLSKYGDNTYQRYDLQESIKRTEQRR